MSAVKNKNKYIIIGAIFSVLAFFNCNKVFASDISASKVIELTNQSRMQNNLSVLKENDSLALAAKLKAEDMMKNDYFSHTSPQGKTPWYWLEKGGYDYKYAGENLAVNYDSAEEQQKGWMNSASHRANILNADYSEIGVAVVEGNINGKRSILTVQVFGAPMAVNAGPKIDSSKVSNVAFVPMAMSAKSGLARFLSQAYGSIRAFGGGKILIALSMAGMLLLGTAYHVSYKNKAKARLQESQVSEAGSQRILVKCEDIMQIIKINVQSSKTAYPVGGT